MCWGLLVPFLQAWAGGQEGRLYSPGDLCLLDAKLLLYHLSLVWPPLSSRLTFSEEKLRTRNLGSTVALQLLRPFPIVLPFLLPPPPLLPSFCCIWGHQLHPFHGSSHFSLLLAICFIHPLNILFLTVLNPCPVSRCSSVCPLFSPGNIATLRMTSVSLSLALILLLVPIQH